MDIKIFAKTLEPSAQAQLDALAGLKPFETSKIRIMPDCHAGAGCVIGFTATLSPYIIPNLIGVDIGCGVIAAELEHSVGSFVDLDTFIRGSVPSGRNVHNNPEEVVAASIQLLCCSAQLKDTRRLASSMGTLGGGNHFIEVDVDSSGSQWLVVHTGSRNLGLQVAEYYQNQAVFQRHGQDTESRTSLIQKLKEEGRQKEIQELLKALPAREAPPDELCWLEGDLLEQYEHDMSLCQTFAALNRSSIVTAILKHLDTHAVRTVESVHNYIDFNAGVMRKGAISAQEGESVIIPLNMRDGTILGVGKGNEDWNCSAPHGAGRLMSRAEARRSLALEDYRSCMSGIYSTSVCPETIDEAPGAYKNAQEIIDALDPAVEIRDILHPVYNFKAKE